MIVCYIYIKEFFSVLIPSNLVCYTKEYLEYFLLHLLSPPHLTFPPPSPPLISPHPVSSFFSLFLSLSLSLLSFCTFTWSFNLSSFSCLSLFPLLPACQVLHHASSLLSCDRCPVLTDCNLTGRYGDLPSNRDAWDTRYLLPCMSRLMCVFLCCQFFEICISIVRYSWAAGQRRSWWRERTERRTRYPTNLYSQQLVRLAVAKLICLKFGQIE